MTYVKSSPKSTPSQTNELQDSLAALFDAIWNVILYAQVCNLMSFQHFFYACNFNPPHLFPSAPKTILFCGKNKNISGCLFTSSQGHRCMDVILHPRNQGSAAVKWMHRHIKLMLQKDVDAFTSQWSLRSVPWDSQHPPLLTSTARVEGKWLFTAYSSIQHATADTYAVQDMASFILMQCMTESSWPSEAFQDLNSNPFWRLVPWTGLRSLPLSILANIGSPELSVPATEFWGHLKPIRCLWTLH